MNFVRIFSLVLLVFSMYFNLCISGSAASTRLPLQSSTIRHFEMEGLI
jgi:hypothetical protein